jgi:hypothetical protein
MSKENKPMDIKATLSATYKIKPLRWEKEGDDELAAYVAGGSYRIIKREDDRQEWESKYYMRYHYSDYYDEGQLDATSIKHAKELAYQNWLPRIVSDLKLMKA